METTTTAARVDDLGEGTQIGNAVLDIAELALPRGAPIEVTFELNQQGRLHVIGREPVSGRIVEATIETASGISPAELAEAKSRSRQVVIS
jgi:molecular chaperone DnaK